MVFLLLLHDGGDSSDAECVFAHKPHDADCVVCTYSDGVLHRLADELDAGISCDHEFVPDADVVSERGAVSGEQQSRKGLRWVMEANPLELWHGWDSAGDVLVRDWSVNLGGPGLGVSLIVSIIFSAAAVWVGEQDCQSAGGGGCGGVRERSEKRALRMRVAAKRRTKRFVMRPSQKILTTTLWIVAVMGMLAVVGSGLWGAHRPDEPSFAVRAEENDQPLFEMPAFKLVDQDGNAFTDESLRRKSLDWEFCVYAVCGTLSDHHEQTGWAAEAAAGGEYQAGEFHGGIRILSMADDFETAGG